MPILKNNKHELFAHPDYNRARWRRRHGKPGRLDRSFRLGSWRSVVDDKFYANLGKMDEGELNTIANELLEGIRRDGESRHEHLEMLSGGFKALGLVIETATQHRFHPRRCWKDVGGPPFAVVRSVLAVPGECHGQDAAGGWSGEGSR
jgi:hypothetical protein